MEVVISPAAANMSDTSEKNVINIIGNGNSKSSSSIILTSSNNKDRVSLTQICTRCQGYCAATIDPQWKFIYTARPARFVLGYRSSMVYTHETMTYVDYTCAKNKSTILREIGVTTHRTTYIHITRSYNERV